MDPAVEILRPQSGQWISFDLETIKENGTTVYIQQETDVIENLNGGVDPATY